MTEKEKAIYYLQQEIEPLKPISAPYAQGIVKGCEIALELLGVTK